MFAGNNVPKDRITGCCRDRFGVNVLVRHDHTQGCRSTYTLRDVGGGVSVFIFGIMSHECDKRCGYRTS